MNKKTDGTADTPEKADQEPRNVRVEALQNRTHILGGIFAAGEVPLLLTPSEAKSLEALGKVRVLGV
jgi:hypothetical protein